MTKVFCVEVTTLFHVWSYIETTLFKYIYLHMTFKVHFNLEI